MTQGEPDKGQIQGLGEGRRWEISTEIGYLLNLGVSRKLLITQRRLVLFCPRVFYCQGRFKTDMSAIVPHGQDLTSLLWAKSSFKLCLQLPDNFQHL